VQKTGMESEEKELIWTGFNRSRVGTKTGSRKNGTE